VQKDKLNNAPYMAEIVGWPGVFNRHIYYETPNWVNEGAVKTRKKYGCELVERLRWQIHLLPGGKMSGGGVSVSLSGEMVEGRPKEPLKGRRNLAWVYRILVDQPGDPRD